MGKSNELILNGKILAACLDVKRIFSAQDSFSGNNGVPVAGSCRRSRAQTFPIQTKSTFFRSHRLRSFSGG
jgi:hypothetical protein